MTVRTEHAESRVTVTTKWSALNPEQKREATRPLIEQQGKSYSEVAAILGAPSRTAIAGVVDRSKRSAKPILVAHKPGFSSINEKKPKVKLARNATQIAREKARRARAKAASPEADAPFREPNDDRGAYDYAWDPLKGSKPVKLEDHTTGCRWTVTVKGESVARFCNEETDNHVYCPAHRALGIRPEAERAARTPGGKTVKFNL